MLAGRRRGIAPGSAAGGRRQRHLPGRALLLRGSPCAIGWVAGWLSAEFPARVVTGHALSRISPRSIGRFGTSWAAQRADQILHAAFVDAFGPDFRDLVWHPTGEQSEAARRSGLLNLPHIPGPHRRYAAQTSDIPYGPAAARIYSTSGGVPI